MSVVNMYLGMSTCVDCTAHMFIDMCRLCHTHFILIYVDCDVHMFINWCRLSCTHFISIYVDCVAHVMSTCVVDVTCFLSIMLIDLWFSRWFLLIVSRYWIHQCIRRSPCTWYYRRWQSFLWRRKNEVVVLSIIA